MFNLKDENFYQYVSKGLKTPYTSESEFRLLLKHIVYTKRLLKKYKNNFVNININLLLNHFIILYNEIDIKIMNHALFFEISEVYWPQVKTILLFLNKIKGDEIYKIDNRIIEISNIKEDFQLNTLIKKITSK